MNIVACPAIERVRRLKAVTEESMEKPKVAFTRALVFFLATAMARLPEEMKRAKIDVTATPFFFPIYIWRY